MASADCQSVKSVSIVLPGESPSHHLDTHRTGLKPIDNVWSEIRNPIIYTG